MLLRQGIYGDAVGFSNQEIFRGGLLFFASEI